MEGIQILFLPKKLLSQLSKYYTKQNLKISQVELHVLLEPVDGDGQVLGVVHDLLGWVPDKNNNNNNNNNNII